MHDHSLEHAWSLKTLEHLLEEVASGAGRCVLVSGAAGSGKSSLVECFAALHGASARFCWGELQAASTPKPLRPVHNIVQQLQSPVSEGLDHGANRALFMSDVLDWLSAGPKPTVAVIEDVHLATESMLDLLKFLGRRVQQVPVLLLLTYRDDEIGPDHPLRFLLGDLPSRSTRRIHLRQDEKQDDGIAPAG
jgi:predicted ATPase